MTKSKKKQQSNKKSSKKGSTKRNAQKQLQTILAEANAQTDPLSDLPPAFLSVPLPAANNDTVGADDDDDDGNDTSSSSPAALGSQNDAAAADAVVVRHFSSRTLPPALLEQCLELFRTNMGELYRRSSWGLNVEEKSAELRHADARFLVVLSSSRPEPLPSRPRSCCDETETTTTSATTNAEAQNEEGADVEAENSKGETMEKETVLGFAHFRYEPDDESHPVLPVTYLYELQVRPSVQKLGLGKKLMTIVELITLKRGLKKCMLTVFHNNEGAMRFYRKNKYEVDESSPSNFSGEECENCDYEILSKSFG